MRLLISTDAPLKRTEVEDDHVAGLGQRVLTESEWDADYGHLRTSSEIVAAVPIAVSRRQLKEQLIVEGLDETVAAILAGMSGAEGKIARNWYAEAIEFERAHPLVAALASVIWPSPAHDDAFRSAQLDRIWTAAGAR